MALGELGDSRRRRTQLSYHTAGAILLIAVKRNDQIASELARHDDEAAAR